VAVINDSFARNPAGRIDLRTWPHSAQVYLNRASAEDLIKALQVCLDTSLPTTGYRIEWVKQHGGTTLEISTDDDTGSRN